MTRKIKTISFLFEEERIYLHVTKNGKFKVPTVKVLRGRVDKIHKFMYPREVLSNPRIREGDPFITLETGEKLRVFQGGSSSYMLAEVESLLDLHEKQIQSSSKNLVNKIKSGKKQTNCFDNYDIFENLEGW